MSSLSSVELTLVLGSFATLSSTKVPDTLRLDAHDVLSDMVVFRCTLERDQSVAPACVWRPSTLPLAALDLSACHGLRLCLPKSGWADGLSFWLPLGPASPRASVTLPTPLLATLGHDVQCAVKAKLTLAFQGTDGEPGGADGADSTHKDPLLQLLMAPTDDAAASPSEHTEVLSALVEQGVSIVRRAVGAIPRSNILWHCGAMDDLQGDFGGPSAFLSGGTERHPALQPCVDNVNPWNNMPREIVAMILHKCVELEEASGWSIRRVCRLWRAIAEHSDWPNDWATAAAAAVDVWNSLDGTSPKQGDLMYMFDKMEATHATCAGVYGWLMEATTWMDEVDHRVTESDQGYPSSHLLHDELSAPRWATFWAFVRLSEIKLALKMLFMSFPALSIVFTFEARLWYAVRPDRDAFDVSSLHKVYMAMAHPPQSLTPTNEFTLRKCDAIVAMLKKRRTLSVVGKARAVRCLFAMSCTNATESLGRSGMKSTKNAMVAALSHRLLLSDWLWNMYHAAIVKIGNGMMKTGRHIKSLKEYEQRAKLWHRGLGE